MLTLYTLSLRQVHLSCAPTGCGAWRISIPLLVICSAVVDNTTLMELYHIATREPYSLLYVKRMVVGSDYLLFKHFDKRLTVQYVLLGSNTLRVVSLCSAMTTTRIKFVSLLVIRRLVVLLDSSLSDRSSTRTKFAERREVWTWSYDDCLAFASSIQCLRSQFCQPHCAHLD